MRKKVTLENYRYMQRKGRQNLKVLLILFYMFLLCYAIIGYFMVDLLFVPHEKDAMWIFIEKAISMLLIWFIIIRMLWRFRKIGRTLFALFAIVSLYTLMDMKEVIEYSITDQIDNILRYLFAALLVLKTILTCSCMIKMRSDPMMRCIWSNYIIYEDALDNDEINEEDEEEQQLQEIPLSLIHIYSDYCDVLIYGDFKGKTYQDEILAYQRSYQGQVIEVICNYSNTEQCVKLEKDIQILLSNDEQIKDDTMLRLRPYGCAVVSIK